MSSLTKGLSGLKVEGDASAAAPPPEGRTVVQRRRLSVMAGKKPGEILDGLGLSKTEAKLPTSPSSSSSSSTAPAGGKRPYIKAALLSKIGYVPFNPGKVNQDRGIEVCPFGGSEEKVVFGVFDGHGALGHEVSQYISTEVTKHMLAQKNLDTEPEKALTKAFLDVNNAIQKETNIDCSFSGTTGILVYINGKNLYSANAGDSRAVLAKKLPGGKYKAVALSSDQKPDRPDEKKRIQDCKGRVEACKGPKGEDIGPARVWLMHQEVPGLAMTRSFGDLVAASVGVTAKPEVWDRVMDESDSFMILASDGVWEFIESQTAVDMVGALREQGKEPEEVCKALVEESTKRWQAEEEVVDDITCIVVYFN